MKTEARPNLAGYKVQVRMQPGSQVMCGEGKDWRTLYKANQGDKRMKDSNVASKLARQPRKADESYKASKGMFIRKGSGIKSESFRNPMHIYTA